MSEVDKLKGLIGKHEEISKRYNSMYQKLQSQKDDPDLRVEVRKVAQEALGTLIEMRDIFVRLSSGNDNHADNLKKTQEQMNVWIKTLEKLGSPISGVPNTTFEEVAGLEDVKQTVKNYLFALKNPDVAKAYNISTNVGMLLYGPPGTGKTLVAKAIAHELGVRFFVITPSMIFGSYVGESERNVRDIFTELRACKDGAVLLVDECESIFARRDGESNRAAIGVANELLQEMNGATDSVGGDRRVILGATNRPWMMDEAYLRYKRFSLHFYIGMPEPEAIEKVIDLGLKKLPHEPQLRAEMIRTFDSTFTCADISGIIEQCAYFAMQDYKEAVDANGGNCAGVALVNMGPRHLKKALANFSHSVTPEDLVEYENFKNSRKEG